MCSDVQDIPTILWFSAVPLFFDSAKNGK